MPNLGFNLQQKLLQVSEASRFTEREKDVLALLQKKEINRKQAREMLKVNPGKLEQLMSKFKAERKKQEEYVLVLLKHNEINLEEACEILNINIEELVNLISKFGIGKFQLPHFGLTADDRTYISRQAKTIVWNETSVD
jgi:hypothetical protein